MKRTRKWKFVEQEAKRLADLGLAPVDIASRLNVQRQTVQRWMAAGKLADTRRDAKAGRTPSVNVSTKPSDWAATVRREYALDATDDQLVVLAEQALGRALDPLESTSNRLAASRTFQGLVKQLALVARQADAPSRADAPVTPVRRVLPPRPVGDPRHVLSMVPGARA